MSSKPTLLFITPVVPKLTGSGMEMRAGMYMEALASFFNLTLAVVAAHRLDIDAELAPSFAGLCSEIILQNRGSTFDKIYSALSERKLNLLSLLFQFIWPKPLTSRIDAAVKSLAGAVAHKHFDAVYCFRLRTARFPAFFRKYRGSCHALVLDLDDYESRAAWRQVVTMRRTAGIRHCLGKLLDVPKLVFREAVCIPKFSIIGVCSARDQTAVTRRFPHVQCSVLPNVIRSPEQEGRTQHTVFTLLFVGTLSYMPNQDAVRYFCEEILPIMRSRTSENFRFLMVGRDPGPKLRALAAAPDIELIESPQTVAPCYATSDLVVVPLRSGGGTRVKILEAFAYGLPVVSTTVGAEGLELTPDLHALIADGPGEFASHCLRAMVDRDLRLRIAAAGKALVDARFKPERLRPFLRELQHNCLAARDREAMHG